MPVIYQIDRANGIIRTRCVGPVTIDEVIDHFRQLERDADCPERLDVLLDISEETSVPKVTISERSLGKSAEFATEFSSIAAPS